MPVTVTSPTTIIVQDSAARGPIGPAANFSIGTVTTSNPVIPATVTNVGNSTDIILNFSIPQGFGGVPGAMFYYVFDANTTTDALPNINHFHCDSPSDQANITTMWFNDLDQANANVGNAITTFFNSNSSPKGFISVRGSGVNEFEKIHAAVDDIVLKSGYFQLNVTTLAISTNPVDNNDLAGFNFSRTGNVGATPIEAYNQANSARDQANTGYGQANSAYAQANAAYNAANNAGGAGLPLANGTSNFDIPVADGYVTVTANNFTWTFNETNGLLELAGNLANFSACSAINFVDNSSGDGAGYSTIELRPDSNATNDQYLIIDPTVPNHIHIRAGGTQDNSAGQLFLGGEYSNFSVGSGANPPVFVTANQKTWTFETTGTFANPVMQYSDLPSPSTVGVRAFISDANVAATGNFGAIVSGGGSNNVPVFSDGTNWLVG